jgi:dipeptidyl aminopeptidase/acylaminoacyl peptidase
VAVDCPRRCGRIAASLLTLVAAGLVALPAASRPNRDARLLAFAAGRGWNTDIYVIRADGRGLRRLTRSSRREDTPTWSPDGRRLAFRSDRDGSAVTRLTRAGSEEQEPAFVPCEGACA